MQSYSETVVFTPSIARCEKCEKCCTATDHWCAPMSASAPRPGVASPGSPATRSDQPIFPKSTPCPVPHLDLGLETLWTYRSSPQCEARCSRTGSPNPATATTSVARPALLPHNHCYVGGAHRPGGGPAAGSADIDEVSLP